VVQMIDETVLSWFTFLVGKNSALDRFLIICSNDYFPMAVIAFFLLALWFVGKDGKERENNHRAVIIAAIAIGSACGFVLAANHIWRHNHPFQDNPALLTYVNQIFYPIHDPAFPSNTSAVTFAGATSVWLKNRKFGYLMFIPAILYPVSKLCAAVYYPSDILAGAVLGILTSLFVASVVMRMFAYPIGKTLIVLRKLCIA
jgi:undecaprenyl-diphosphatase